MKVWSIKHFVEHDSTFAKKQKFKVWHAWNFTYRYIYFQIVKVNSYFRMIVKHFNIFINFSKGMIILQAEI